MKRVTVTGIHRCEHLPLEFTVEGGVVRGPDSYTVTVRDEKTHEVKERRIESTAAIKARLGARSAS